MERNGGWITKKLEWTNKAEAQLRPTIAMVDRKYQKQENRTNNLNGNTNNSSKHNNNEKNNSFVGNNNKNSYGNDIIIIGIKMA